MASFARLLAQLAPPSLTGAEPFALLPYPTELRLKTEALSSLWKQEMLPGNPGEVVASPLARGYRTTSKRRLNNPHQGMPLGEHSMLEPDSHNEFYDLLQEKLSTPAFRPLARALNWVILRGSYEKHALILNVAEMDANLVRKVKLLAEQLPKMAPAITAAMLYFDPTRSDYYLEALESPEGLQSKHLFGPRLLTLAFGEHRLKYPLTGFSQVNESMVPLLVQHAERMLACSSEDRLLDLYCGYGLFSLTLGRKAKECYGIEMTGESIATAQESARRMGLSRVRFKAGRITRESLPSLLPSRGTGSEVMLLDPPRQGTEPGVIALLAQRKPRRVLQIFCGTDEVAPSLREWKMQGYKVQEIVALDLFPGTPNLETLVSFIPA